jgi:hypothetical protein
VDLVQVDVVGPQPAERIVDGVADVLAREPPQVRVVPHRVEHLGGDDHLVAPRPEILQRAPEDLLAPAEGVHVGGVEEVDAELEGPADERAAFLLLQDPFAPAFRA